MMVVSGLCDFRGLAGSLGPVDLRTKYKRVVCFRAVGRLAFDGVLFSVSAAASTVSGSLPGRAVSCRVNCPRSMNSKMFSRENLTLPAMMRTLR